MLGLWYLWIIKFSLIKELMKIKNFGLIIIALFFEFFRDYFFINTNLYIEYLENIESGLNVFNYTDSQFLRLLKTYN